MSFNHKNYKCYKTRCRRIKSIKFLITLCILCSSLPACLVFIFIWIDKDLDYAWDKFEDLVGEALK